MSLQSVSLRSCLGRLQASLRSLEDVSVLAGMSLVRLATRYVHNPVTGIFEVSGPLKNDHCTHLQLPDSAHPTSELA